MQPAWKSCGVLAITADPPYALTQAGELAHITTVPPTGSSLSAAPEVLPSSVPTLTSTIQSTLTTTTATMTINGGSQSSLTDASYSSPGNLLPKPSASTKSLDLDSSTASAENSNIITSMVSIIGQSIFGGQVAQTQVSSNSADPNLFASGPSATINEFYTTSQSADYIGVPTEATMTVDGQTITVNFMALESGTLTPGRTASSMAEIAVTIGGEVFAISPIALTVDGTVVCQDGASLQLTELQLRSYPRIW
ncbi:hypothetical protein MMC15_006072 [Xylographa vitiligo]|nr:hypothetical protein [Xylographa vitiligo]